MTEEKLALELLLKGESEKIKQQYGGAFEIRYAPLKSDIQSVGIVSQAILPSLQSLSTEVKNALVPNQNVFNFHQVDLDELSFFKLLGFFNNELKKQLNASIINLNAIVISYNQLNPIFSGKTDLGSIAVAEDAAIQLLTASRIEYRNLFQFNELLSAVYLATKQEYKKLKRKFLGSNTEIDRQDELEDQLLNQIFGFRPPRQGDNSKNQAVALIDDNCLLTQLLDEISNNVPTYYERSVPVIRRGVITSKTKSIKQLDDGEVEDFSQLIQSIANETVLDYIENPKILLTTVIGLLQTYYDLHARLLPSLENLLKKVDIGSLNQKEFLNPKAIARQFTKINFLSIRPLAEDICPRTRVEREYATARMKLITYLKETLDQLKSMKEHTLEEKTQKDEFSLIRTKEIINLKTKLREVNKTEKDKLLARNIRDDNEFYVSKGGDLGSLQVEREPAPKITYDDVVGDSFVKAKAHIEEVVEIASRANIMKISAPRGDVRSNLLMIGPFGCGKTEFARAIGSDKRIIGFSVNTADMLTAYMHESVKNVKRLYDHATNLRKQSRFTKPVAILLDEFDGLFTFGEGVNAAYDGRRMETTLQEMMDGVVSHEGVVLVALTNNPKAVPKAILRRFKYVDVVGQLNDEERAQLFEQFLTRGLPISPLVTKEHYLEWGSQLEHAPGDVIGKVADEVHFKFMKEYIDNKRGRTDLVEKTLRKRLANRDITPKDHLYLKKALSEYRWIEPADITSALEEVIKQPQVKMQIKTAEDVYRDAEATLHELTLSQGIGFGQKVGRKSKLFGE